MKIKLKPIKQENKIFEFKKNNLRKSTFLNTV